MFLLNQKVDKLIVSFYFAILNFKNEMVARNGNLY